MTVQTRFVASTDFAGTAMVGAVRMPSAIFVACPVGVSPTMARSLFAERLQSVGQVGRGVVATLLPGLEGDDAEPELLKDRKVLLAVRNGETAQAAMDWLAFHAKHHGADAALILDRAAPSDSSFHDALDAMKPNCPVIVVKTEKPLGRKNAPDARHPALAPGAPKREQPPVDPWHAPLGEPTIFELLRHRFLSQSKAVALLDIADFVLKSEDGPMFDRVCADPGKALPLRGIESYPWRLRQDRPALHGDHIAVRRGERRRVISWALAPQRVPDGSPFRPGRPPSGMRVQDAQPARFSRAMGVVFPGTPVNALVRKSDLIESDELVDFSINGLGANPIRLPKQGAIPKRPNSNRITVVTAMKNEGPFILDWIAHNRTIGIDQHLVYTNDCEDGTDRLLEALQEAGVTRRDNPFRRIGKVPQHAAFRAAKNEAVVKRSDWLLTLDVDEYINVHVGDGHLNDLLAAVPDAHVISMPWRLFGNSDIREYVDAPVTRQFVTAAPAYAPRPLQAWAFKSLFRNAGLFRRLGVHRPKGVESGYQAGLSWVDGSGRPLPPAVWRGAWRMSKSNWGYDLVSVNHYAVRSAESFLVKSERGRVNHTSRVQDAAYWFRMNQNAEEETSILRLARAVEAEKARLMALPGVADAHAAAVDWHRSRIETLRGQPEYAAIYDEITSERMRRLSRMATYFGMNVQLAGPSVIPDEVVARDPSVPFFFTVDVPSG